MSLRVICWNIRHGGGDGDRSARIHEAFSGFNADLLVVPEFRTNPAGDRLKAHLATLGYHLSHPETPPKLNTVLVACRTPIRSANPLLGREELGHRLWRVDLEWISVCAVYMALGKEKLPYWQALIEAGVNPDAPDLVIGDFNTGDNHLDLTPGATPFELSEFMVQMSEVGYVDVWRARHGERRDYSWYSNHGGGFRLDHAFLRRDLDGVRGCEFDHAPRESKASDHSALILDLENFGSE